MTTAIARETQDTPLPWYGKALIALAFVSLAALTVYFGIIAPNFLNNHIPAPAWANQVLPITDNAATEAVESGYSVRSVLYLEDVRAGDVAFAVNNLMGSSGLRANEGGNVLLLIVTGQTEQAARTEAQRWQSSVQTLLSGWLASK